jgi:hypothetical protein
MMNQFLLVCANIVATPQANYNKNGLLQSFFFAYKKRPQWRPLGGGDFTLWVTEGLCLQKTA